MSGISIGVKFVRTMGLLAGLGSAGVSVIGIPLSSTVMIWKSFYELTGGRLPVITDQLAFEIPPFLAGMLFGWEGTSVPRPPAWSWVAETSLQWPLVLGVGLMLLHALLPMSIRIRSAVRSSAMMLPKDSPIQGFVEAFRKRTGGPSARVWVSNERGIEALALSGPLGGNAIVLSAGLVSNAPSDVIQWVVAHEYAHIHHGDSRSGSQWLLGMQGVHLLDRVRRLSYMLTVRTIAALPIPGFLVWLLVSAFYVMDRMGRMCRWIGVKVFLIFDRWASRRMEFAADRFAAFAVGTEPGIRLFSSLKQDLEPTRGGLFATHPSLSERVARLRQIKSPA